MAVSITNLTTDSSVVGASSYNTKSVTPTANNLVLLTVVSRTGISTDPNQPTVTGENLTWVAVNSVVYDNTSSSRRRITLFRAMGSSPSAGALTIDFGGQAQTSIDVIWDQVTGMNTSGANGAGAIIQSVTNFDATGGANTLSVTLAAFTSSINATYGTFGFADASQGFVPGSGFSTLGSVTDGMDNIVSSEWKTANDTSVDASWTGVGEVGGIAVEINASPIALDATAVSTDQTTTPITWNHTCTGSNLLLIVGVVLSATTSGPTATGVTFNGVAMTKIRADTHNTANSILESSIWFLPAPATGTHQVSVAFSGGTLPHGAGISASYTGAQQTAAADANNGTNGTASGSQTFSVTTVADLAWIFSVGINAATSSPTMAANSTSRGTVTLASTIPAILRGQDTNSVVTPPAATTVGFTIGGTGLADWTMSGASFAPFSAAAGNATLGFKTLLGVGM